MMYRKGWHVVRIVIMAGILSMVTYLPGAWAQNTGTSAAPSGVTVLPSVTGMTPDQAAAARNLTPAQRGAIAQELGKTGGKLTPEAVDALKGKPEFQGLSPEEVAKGKELIEQAEKQKADTAAEQIKKPAEEEKADAAAAEKAEKPTEAQKRTITDLPKGETLFERAQLIGSYQDISLDLRPFGYDFFREAAVKVITDWKDIPIPLQYVVGPGDEVRIMLWGRVNASYKLTVDRDGKIAVPDIGPLNVAGMTFEEMTGYLTKQAQQITGTNVDITMGALRTIPIFVLGDVRRPGAYTIGALATITDALLLSGGPSEIGTMRTIQLKRNDTIIKQYDLYDLLLKGDKSQDMTLQAGDIVFVPVIGPYAAIAGNVKRPAIYELKDDYSLAHLFDLAGGIIPTAYTQQIQVERTIKNEKKIVVDIDDKNLSRAKGILLQDGDIVKVFPIVEKDVNAVYLQGNVKRGGKYALTPGMRLKDILKSEQELLPDTYFDYALIKRVQPPGMETTLVPFSLEKLLLRNDPKSNLQLEPQDQIFIFSKWFFRDKPYYAVSGEVRQGGRFDLSENTRVKDAILTAGDLTKEAYLKKGELIRVDKNKEFRTLYFNVARAMAGDPAENILLQDEDRIIIHSLYEEKWREEVSIAGEIKDPGTFLLTEKMRISDLFFKAGGQTRDTLLEEAELYRTDWKTKEVTLVKLDLGKALAGDRTHNIALQDLDRLVVHSTWEKVFKKSVSVDGEVRKPGTYQYADNMTVRDLMFAAGGETRDTYFEEAELYRTDWRTKKVTLVKLDLGKALAGDPKNNIVLQDLDHFIVHSMWEQEYRKMVFIEGLVRNPGEYRFADNMTVRDLIFAAGNVLESTSLEEAELSSRIINEENKAEVVHRNLDLGKALAGDPAHNVTLKPYDRLFVKQIPNWRDAEKYATIAGEVVYPGRYALAKGERLSSLIERAGGYSDLAYTRGAVFTRESVRAMQQKSLTEMVERMERELVSQSSVELSTAASKESISATQAELEQKQKFLVSLRELKATGRMTVRIGHLRLLKGSEYDIMLEDGDSLTIPPRNDVVTVVGSVMTHGSYIYSDEYSYDNYIDMAGGYTKFADKKNVFIVKVDGSAKKARGAVSWNPFKERWEMTAFGEKIKEIEPGDTIVVPEEIGRIAWLREIKDVTQVLMQLAVTAGVVYNMW